MCKRKNFFTAISLIVSISLLFFAAGCGKGIAQATSEPISKTEILLDTPCSVTIYDNVPESVLDKTFAKLQEINDKMNASDPNSEISKINQNAGIGYVKVSGDTFYVIKEGLMFSKLESDRFDITVGPLVKLWGIGTDHARVPSPSELKAALTLVNYKNVMLDEANQSVMLKYKGMSLDLGGIAKGYAGDAASQVLRDNGVKHAIIDLGGNVVAYGSKTDGTDWRIGIQDPNSERGDYLGILHVSNMAVVTSGIYERYFIQDGKRYHHIMDTKTGYPVDNELASVTIVTKQSINGDALAKAFCMGVEKGLPFVESQGVEAVFVTKDNKVYITPGLKNNFVITNESYKLAN